MGQAIVGKIAKFVRFEIENRERLFSIGSVRAKPAMEKNGEPPVRRKSDRRRQIVDGTRMAGNLAEQFAVG